MQTPLAWHNLTHDLKRLGLAVGGIGFAVLLMFMQLGFRGALFDSTLALPKRFDADIILINPQRYTLTVYQKIPRKYLQLLESLPAVASAEALYLENIRSFWKRDERPAGPPIRVLAFNPNEAPLDIPEIKAQTKLLEQADSVLLDRKSKTDFQGVDVGDYVELNGRRVKIVGTYELGTDFADDGTIVCNDRTFQKAFFPHLEGEQGLEAIDVGLVKVKEGTSIDEARTAIDDLLPPDALVMTKPQFLEFEHRYWSTSTPIGYVFLLGTIMGFLVGMIICYQILFSDIADHLKEFATLKAMGYRPRFFIGVVLQESILLSVFGFGPGLAISVLLYEVVHMATGLVMQIDMSRIVLVAVLTTVMCIVSGCLTMRQVLTADPAELF
jgi:putative ABC transport system permease protein